jgi:GNAT superfamily N-acetyltransferase
VASELRIERFPGQQAGHFVEALARMRIAVFREFPYLYDGSEQYEARYLRTYVQAPDSLIVLVFDGERVVGATTALPLEHETEEIRRPFIEHGYDITRVFYFGESVLLPEYRGRGLGVRFFEERERHASALERFEWTTFCAVQRPVDHPRRPPNYIPLDGFWTKRGYTRHPELHTELSWKDLDEPAESSKPMIFWLKRLTR